MATVKIKNVSNITRNYNGQDIFVNEIHTIPSKEMNDWQNDDSLLEDILHQYVEVHDGSGIVGTNTEQINYLKGITAKDNSGRELIRTTVTEAGWAYLAHFFEFETSTLSSLYCKDWQNNDIPNIVAKYYDSNNTEITTSLGMVNCVKTVVTWSPQYDYEIMSGHVHQNVSPSSDVRVWVIGGAVELGAAGVKEFCRGLNLKYMGADEQIETDGRASKMMVKTTSGVPYNTNQLQVIVRHPAGTAHKIMICIEIFRA